MFWCFQKLGVHILLFFLDLRYVDEGKQSVIIVSCSVAESDDIVPQDKSYVRVQNYRSVMVVRAHETFEKKGFDYALTYYDNPECYMPKYAYNWIVNSGGPLYLKQVSLIVLIHFFA